jgi:3alpha(or 20beta)-hydroxysteroid dehydrogenase
VTRLDTRVALVTGGARGLGAAIVAALHAEGATVVAADIRHAEGKELVAGLGERAHYVDLDVTDEAAWREVIRGVIAECGRLDVVVNNAGMVDIAPMVTQPFTDYLRIVNVNQHGVWLGMQAALPGMIEAGRGSIINISSIDGIRGMPGTAAYCAAKHAVVGMTKAVALEVAPLGIRVNAVCPGGMLTPLLADVDLSMLGDVDLSSLPNSIPMRRMADPAEVAKAVAFLASDDASYCTGAEIVLDGGWTAGYHSFS